MVTLYKAQINKQAKQVTIYKSKEFIESSSENEKTYSSTDL